MRFRVDARTGVVGKGIHHEATKDTKRDGMRNGVPKNERVTRRFEELWREIWEERKQVCLGCGYFAKAAEGDETERCYHPKCGCPSGVQRRRPWENAPGCPEGKWVR